MKLIYDDVTKNITIDEKTYLFQDSLDSNKLNDCDFCIFNSSNVCLCDGVENNGNISEVIFNICNHITYGFWIDPNDIITLTKEQVAEQLNIPIIFLNIID